MHPSFYLFWINYSSFNQANVVKLALIIHDLLYCGVISALLTLSNNRYNQGGKQKAKGPTVHEHDRQMLDSFVLFCVSQ